MKAAKSMVFIQAAILLARYKRAKLDRSDSNFFRVDCITVATHNRLIRVFASAAWLPSNRNIQVRLRTDTSWVLTHGTLYGDQKTVARTYHAIEWKLKRFLDTSAYAFHSNLPERFRPTKRQRRQLRRSCTQRVHERNR